jgi:hypothetical protein
MNIFRKRKPNSPPFVERRLPQNAAERARRASAEKEALSAQLDETAQKLLETDERVKLLLLKAGRLAATKR